MAVKKLTGNGEPVKKANSRANDGVKTVLRTVGLSGVTTGGAEGAVDVKDGKILEPN